MTAEKKVLVLEGSPKKQRSSSKAIGNYLISKLVAKSWQAEQIHVYHAIKSTESKQDMIDSIEHADLIILACPLYVDCLPAGVIRGLELIYQHRRIAATHSTTSVKSPGFLAILNCGFPESNHNHVAIDICRNFSQQVQFEWLGGISIGMGGVIAGHPLEQRGKMVYHLLEALDLTADALSQGFAAPADAITTAQKPFMPKFLYWKMGNFGWNHEAKRNGVRKLIKAQPFTDL